MTSGLLYIAAVLVIIIAGFAFALLMSRFAIREADRGWPQSAATTASFDEVEHGEAPVLLATSAETASQIAR